MIRAYPNIFFHANGGKISISIGSATESKTIILFPWSHGHLCLCTVFFTLILSKTPQVVDHLILLTARTSKVRTGPAITEQSEGHSSDIQAVKSDQFVCGFTGV